MTAILNSQTSDGPVWSRISREVVEAKRRYQKAQGFPGTDEEGALSDLLSKIDDMSEFHHQQSVHERRLIAVILDRTGGRALSDDLSRAYQQLVSRLSSGLHQSVPLEQARLMFAQCIDLLNRLFLPPEVRSERLNDLAQRNYPSDDDVSEARKLIVTPVHLRSFLSSVVTPTWLHRLTDTGMLDPPDDGGPWPVFGVVGSLSQRDPDEVVKWLTKMYDRVSHTPGHSCMIGMAALDVGEPALQLVYRIVSRHVGQGHAMYIASMAADKAHPESEMFEKFSDIILGQRSGSLGSFGEVVAALVKGVRRENVRRRLKLIGHKLIAIPHDDLSQRLREIKPEGSISEREDPTYRDRFEDLLEALIAIAGSAQRECWIGTPCLVEQVSDVPGLVGLRLRMWLLGNDAGVAIDLLVDEIAKAIKHRNPNGDDIRIIQRVRRELDGSQYVDRWRAALGPAPTVEQLAQAFSNDQLIDPWLRAYWWSPLIPELFEGIWSVAVSVLGAKYGHLDAEYLSSVSPTSFGGLIGSPIDYEELNAITPLEAARKISEWRPDSDPSALVSANELARTLERIVTENPGAWAAEPVTIAMQLRHPTYIHHYLRAVAGALRKESIHVDRLLSLLFSGQGASMGRGPTRPPSIRLRWRLGWC